MYTKIALDKIFIEGLKYRKIGVITGTFLPESERMISLFDEDSRRAQTTDENS